MDLWHMGRIAFFIASTDIIDILLHKILKQICLEHVITKIFNNTDDLPILFSIVDKVFFAKNRYF